MGWLSSLFSGSETATKVVDGVLSGTDKLFYTDEEKADFQLEKAKFALKWLEQSSAQNLARRYIAVITVGFFLSYTLLVTTLILFGILPEVENKLMTILGSYLFPSFSGIMAFYFMTHLLRGAKK